MSTGRVAAGRPGVGAWKDHGPGGGTARGAVGSPGALEEPRMVRASRPVVWGPGERGLGRTA
eukprot:3949640-Lingulodinium_polyedra.AAC.1